MFLKIKSNGMLIHFQALHIDKSKKKFYGKMSFIKTYNFK